MYARVRPWLFRLDPERAHAITLGLIRLAGYIPILRELLSKIYAAPPQPVRVFGLEFKNPVGLAAGYDKDGLGWRGLASMGFGHIEIGTVTLKSQPGNPRPRVFRLVEDRALVNRMGFPGLGADFVIRQLYGPRPNGLILGVNIGKNKETPLEAAGAEYTALVAKFALCADYLAINVSSPNTPGLRDLQAPRSLEGLLLQISQVREKSLVGLKKKLPVLVKLAPDLDKLALGQSLEAVCATGIDGVIAANTTLARENLHSVYACEAGGLSGAPLFARSLEMVKTIVRETSGRLPVIAVGGIMSAAQAQEMLDAGASLVQVYTGLIYEGPSFVRDILTGLRS
jgi:dihydroorotate dehydrogenase